MASEEKCLKTVIYEVVSRGIPSSFCSLTTISGNSQYCTTKKKWTTFFLFVVYPWCCCTPPLPSLSFYATTAKGNFLAQLSVLFVVKTVYNQGYMVTQNNDAKPGFFAAVQQRLNFLDLLTSLFIAYTRVDHWNLMLFFHYVFQQKYYSFFQFIFFFARNGDLISRNFESPICR